MFRCVKQIAECTLSSTMIPFFQIAFAHQKGNTWQFFTNSYSKFSTHTHAILWQKVKDENK